MLGSKKERAGGKGRKNTPAQNHCSFGKLRTLTNGALDWWGLGEVDWCLSIKCQSILFIAFSFAACNCGKELFWIQKWRTQERFLTLLSKQVFWNWSGRECRVCCAMKKSERFLHSSGIRTRFAFSAKTLSHFYLMRKCCLFQYVFFLWRVGYALEGSMFWVSKCDFSRLFNTEGSWRACSFPVVLNFWSAWFALWCKTEEHFLWPLPKRKALSCGSTRLLGPLSLSQDLNN